MGVGLTLEQAHGRFVLETGVLEAEWDQGNQAFSFRKCVVPLG